METSLDRSRKGMKVELARLDKIRTSDVAVLDKTLKQIVELHRDLADNLIKSLILYAYSIVVPLTPVDTGFARGSWQVGTTSLDHDPTPEQALQFMAAANTAIETHMAEIAPLASDVWYLTNNAEYIMALEAGWSTKQPGGFIATMIAALQSKMNEVTSQWDA